VPLSPADLDAFVAEQRRSAALVGLDPAQVPASMAELAAYYAEVRPELYACPEARRALRLSYHPPVPSSLLPLRAVVPPVNTLAFATLPRWARRMYGAPGTSPGDLAASAALRAARRAVAGFPGRLVYEPALRRIFAAASKDIAGQGRRAVETSAAAS
jgi:uncharacterized protein (DUF2236 family)